MRVDRAWFEVQEHSLVEEWVKQADRMYDICLALADAKQKVNECENNLSVVYAEQARDARLHPIKHGIEKATVDAIKEAVTVSSAVQEAEKELVEAKHAKDVLEAAVTAMEHKKRALSDLVTLHGASYFAEPKASKEAVTKAKTGATFAKDRRKTKA